MMKKFFLLVPIILLLAACASTGNFSFRPLYEFQPEITISSIWQTDISLKTETQLTPVVIDTAIIAPTANGKIVAIDKNNGSIIWQKQLPIRISAGFSENNGNLFAISSTGNLVDINSTDGNILWQKPVAADINTMPADGFGVVAVKITDGSLAAFSEKDGEKLWNIDVKVSCQPKIANKKIIVGLDDGKIAAIDIHSGRILFAKKLFNSKVTNISIFKGQIFAASANGKFAAINLETGKLKFRHQVAPCQGLAIDSNKIYFVDTDGMVWGFDRDFGIAYFKQIHIARKNLSAPIFVGRYIVNQGPSGYIYWLDKHDGHLVGRNHTNVGTLFSCENKLFVYSNTGTITAFLFQKTNTQ